MTQELYQLLHRQTLAVETLEGRLRALELVIAADERRFVAVALDELERASEQLSALELTRSMALTAAGMSPDISARELLSGIHDEGDRALLAGVIDRLRQASERLEDARERTRVVVGRSASELRSRIDAAERFAAV